jgi:hypothetical protein
MTQHSGTQTTKVITVDIHVASFFNRICKPVKLKSINDEEIVLK